MFSISTTVDGVFHSDDVEPRMLLVHYLRTRLGRTGTVIGCVAGPLAKQFAPALAGLTLWVGLGFLLGELDRRRRRCRPSW